MIRLGERIGMEDHEIEAKIRGFARWHYQFDLQGHLTQPFEQDIVVRHAQRKRYFFDPLVQFFGGSLKGKAVLDLGCNAGFWSLHALQAGCDRVVGIDGRQMHIDQANFVFQVHQIDPPRYQFVTANLFEIDFAQFGRFDIVFCLGLMYHVCKPVELMEKIAAVNTDILVIDTDISLSRGSRFDVGHETVDCEKNAVDYGLILRPTRKAVVDLMVLFGYTTRVLKPNFQTYEGSPSYKGGWRRAFIGAKISDLNHFPADTEPDDLLDPKKAGIWRRGYLFAKRLKRKGLSNYSF